MPISDALAEEYPRLFDIKKAMTQAQALEDDGDSFAVREKWDEAIAKYGSALLFFSRELRSDMKVNAGIVSAGGDAPDLAEAKNAVSPYVNTRFVGLRSKFNNACVAESKARASLAAVGLEVTQGPTPQCLEFQNRLESYDEASVAADLKKIGGIVNDYYALSAQASAEKAKPGGSVENLKNGIFDPVPALEAYRKAGEASLEIQQQLKLLSVRMFIGDGSSPSETQYVMLRATTPSTVGYSVSLRLICNQWREWSAKQTTKPVGPKECR